MANFKVADTQQAKIVYSYERTKKILYKTNAAIWKQKMCKIMQMTRRTTRLYIIVHNYSAVFSMYMVTITKRSEGSHKA
jgi:hypothetical protein